jgi:pimeloyl-ACP methyl ester carboxylesterase
VHSVAKQSAPMAGRISSHVLATEAGTVSFYEHGKATNLPALVLLPGLTCSAKSLLEDLSALARTTQVIAVEWRGHGKSTPGRGQIRHFAADAMAVIRKRLRGKKMCILGHSVGARVLWSMLDDYDHELRDVLEGVAFVDQDPRRSIGRTSAGPHDIEHAQHVEINKQMRLGRQPFQRQLQTLFSVENGFASSPAALSNWWTHASRCDNATVADTHWDAMTTDFMHTVQGIRIPVMIMAGDSTIDPNGVHDRMARAAPPHGAHFALLPGGSHMPFDQPELVPEINHLISSLLTGSLENNTLPPRRSRALHAAGFGAVAPVVPMMSVVPPVQIPVQGWLGMPPKASYRGPGSSRAVLFKRGGA